MNKTWRTLSLNSYIVISLNWKNAPLLYKETKLALFGCTCFVQYCMLVTLECC